MLQSQLKLYLSKYKIVTTLHSSGSTLMIPRNYIPRCLQISQSIFSITEFYYDVTHILHNINMLVQCLYGHFSHMLLYS